MEHKRISSRSPLRKAFTMLELLFVIVILGILGKFGVEFLVQSYNNFLSTSINAQLQSNSATAVEYISTKLQHRIKESVIARKGTDSSFELLSSASGNDYTILEWIGSDSDGFRGNTAGNLPAWSGVIDLLAGDANKIVSPGTNTGTVSSLIDILSYGDSSISNAALFFVGSNTYRDGFGWGGAITDQNQVMHPITAHATDTDTFIPLAGSFAGVTVFEYYKLAWTAYAIVHNNNELWLYYDYQPWAGEGYADGKSALIMENVTTFRFVSIGSLIKIQVCVESALISGEEYSLCKEKTIY